MTKNKSRLLILWGIFAVYSFLTLLGALNHELWLDEAQAWVIIRDVPLSELPHFLNVEGHPPLWYLTLYPFVKLGFPTCCVSLISWFFTAVSALVLLFKVELPLPLKAVILASSGFLYFNSVMLRVYCLIPLLMFLILWVYPKRREYPVVYGLLIALLANTHVFICGIVGMLGIFMICDLFREWKRSSKKENLGKLIGLAIAGAGVLILIIPLIGSTEANGAISIRMTNSIIDSMWGIFDRSLNDVFIYSVCPEDYGYANSPIWLILLIFIKLFFIIMLVVLRHWRKAFAVELGFLLFYCIICGSIWITITNRAVIFILSLAFVLCLSQHEKPVFKDYRISEQITGKIRAFVEWLIKTDKNARKVYIGILFVFLAVTVPSGAAFLFDDITGTFCGAKETAEYIAENLEHDAVFVHLGGGMPEITFFDPDIKIFSADSCGLTTFAKWEYKNYPKESAETLLKALAEYDNVYFIYYYTDEMDNTFYISDGKNCYDYHNSIALAEFDKNAVEVYIERYSKNDEKE